MQQYYANGHLIPLSTVPAFCLQLPAGETIDSVQHFVYVLDCISLLFKQHIPQIGNKELTIVCDPYESNPICYRASHLIILSTNPSNWCQIAYQFAHELCHYAIPADVDSSLRWLEESICETASLYFMYRLTLLWNDRNEQLRTTAGSLYAPEFTRYAIDSMKQFKEFDLKDATAISELESNCYDRLKNRYVANHLLSIFIEYPQTWEAVPLLCQIRQSSLGEAIDAWLCQASPSAQQGLQRIRDLMI